MFEKCLDNVATLECCDQNVDKGQLHVTLVATKVLLVNVCFQAQVKVLVIQYMT